MLTIKIEDDDDDYFGNSERQVHIHISNNKLTARILTDERIVSETLFSNLTHTR